MGSKSSEWFERAEKAIPGGVNSPVRAFASVGGNPPFISRGLGSRIWDEDGHEYIDYVGSWGPLILGHAYPGVVEAVSEAARRGMTFGAATSKEVLLAEKVQSAFPSIERLRLVSSGTEATMTAVRLARAFTGKDKILKFEGCYHGHADPFLVKAGSGLLTLGNPSSAGVPQAVLRETVVASYNSAESAEEAFQKYGKELACVIVEPVAGNMGVVLPRSGFLEKLAELCRKSGAILIFDEVITGFRLRFGGYQGICGITPDLTTLGKIIGGGLPIGAVGGKKEIMSLLAPLGPVYQAGTLSGNPAAVAAGLATLDALSGEKDLYGKLEEESARLAHGITASADKYNVPVTLNRIGSMFTLFFNRGPVETYEAVLASSRDLYKALFWNLQNAGIYLPPSPFEAWFVSFAHTGDDISRTIQAIEKSFSLMRETIPAVHE